MTPTSCHYDRRARHTGVTLIELMIAMVLGLLISAAALGTFISNRETFRATENLSRIQESSRVAFELLSRDLREAGGNPCGNELPTANVLNNAGSQWWSTWTQPVRGYENGALAGSATGTDAIEVMASTSTGLSVTEHNPSSAQFKVNTTTAGIQNGDVLLVCDFVQAAVFQASNVNAANNTLVHNTGNSVTPGNCSKGLGVPTDCGSVTGTAYEYGKNSIIARLRAVRWYIDDNDHGTRSLYRMTLSNTGGTTSAIAQQVAEGVEDMQLSYLQRDGSAYATASAVTDWATIVGVRIQLTLKSPEAAGTGNARLERSVEHTIALRNRDL